MNKHCQPGVINGLLSFVWLFFVSCASSQLTDAWTNPDYKGPPLKKLLVLGVSNEPAQRRTFENEFIKALKDAGVDAVASYNFIPEDGQAEESRVDQAVKDAGAEGVLITRLVGRHAGAQINPLAGYYDGYAWAYGYDPAMVSETTTVVLKTTLYGVDPAHLLWSGTTETFEPKPTSIEQQMPEFAKIIIKTLEKHKLII